MVLWHPMTSWGLRNRIFSKKSGQKAPKTRLPPYWDGLRYMGALTLNNAFFPRISNAHIFRTTHRIVMIFSSKCRWKVIWQILSTIRTVEYSTGPMRTLKEPIYWASNLAPKLMVWKHQKLLVEQKNWIFQSPRYRYTNPTTEKETSNKH